MERFLPQPLHTSSLGEQRPFPDSTYQRVERHFQSTSFSCAGLKIAWHSPQQEGSVALPLLIMEWPSSQHHRSTVKTDSSYCPVHSCFAKSQPSLGSPCPRQWRQAMPLEYSWGSLELLPLNILLVQVVVLLTRLQLLGTGNSL